MKLFFLLLFLCLSLCSRFRVGHLLDAPAAMAAIDATVYTDKDHTPELALRQIFARTKLPVGIRLKLADLNFIDCDALAAIADSPAVFRTTIATILAADPTKDDEDAVKAIWIEAKGNRRKRSNSAEE